MSDKARKKAEEIREDGTKGTLVPFPYEKVIELIEEHAQVMQKHNELIGKLQELTDNNLENEIITNIKDLIIEYKI